MVEKRRDPENHRLLSAGREGHARYLPVRPSERLHQDSALGRERDPGSGAMELITILGVIALTRAATLYATFGISAYPRPEWLIEVLAAIIYLIPVFQILRAKGDRIRSVRW